MISPKEGPDSIPFREAFRYWLRLGFVNFGGPAGQIAMMHRDLVIQRRWITEDRFLHALNYCMLLPGPEAQQLAIYIGWLLHGYKGGVVAGAFFVLPSVFVLLALSWVYTTWGAVGWVAAFFYGLKPAVVAVVAEAVLRIGRRALVRRYLWAVAGVSFLSLHFLHVPFPLLILGAAALGILADRTGFGLRIQPPVGHAGSGADPAAETHLPKRSTWESLLAPVICLLLWMAPLAAVWAISPASDVFLNIGIFFSKAAMVTFGGAYAVLSYISRMAVEHYAWLEPAQMIDGLGLAESTPGPLIMVTQFVGFLAAWNYPGHLPPSLAGVLGGLLTTWVTFLPSFLWIFLGAHYIEELRGVRWLHSALTFVTAAVVGVILSLAVFFARHTLFPSLDRPDAAGIFLAIAAFTSLVRFRSPMIPTLAVSSALGMIWKLAAA
ncbi:MAG: chromate efflux transporter [Nitrospirae bacterium]|nr:chromate efflux transporter [Nitrospirota bacterium]